MKIHGLSLPAALDQALESKSLTELDRDSMLRIFGVTIGWNLRLSRHALEEETMALRSLQGTEFAPAYGLEAGSLCESGKLDADHCLCLAVNQDEEGLCLDYRTTPESPSVVIGVWKEQPDEQMVWIRVADTFSQFMETHKNSFR